MKHDWRQRYHRELRDSRGGPHEPKNAKQQEISEESFAEELAPRLRDVYVIILKTRGQDTRIGPVYFDRDQADAAVEEFLSNNSYANSWWVLRHGEEKT